MDERSAGQAGAEVRPWPRAAARFARSGPWIALRGGRSWIPSAASRSRSAAGTGRSSLELAGAAVRIEGGPVILDGLSFDVAPGERLAVVGPNGAGKTTLLRLLSGRVALSSGAVRVGGADVGRLSFAERARRIAVVVQNDLPDLRLTVADYVALGRIPHRGRATPAEDRRIVDRALDRVGLAGFGARRLDGLSGGERQRSAIARAVAQDPQVLLLDEPTNHLDPRARADMLALARDLGITVVAVLHDLGLVRSFADRVAILDRGRLVAIGPPEAALTPGTVRAVFGMDCFAAVNPATGRTVLVFDAPSR